MSGIGDKGSGSVLIFQGEVVDGMLRLMLVQVRWMQTANAKRWYTEEEEEDEEDKAGEEDGKDCVVLGRGVAISPRAVACPVAYLPLPPFRLESQGDSS